MPKLLFEQSMNYDIRTSATFTEDLELYRKTLVQITKQAEGANLVKVEGLASIMPFEVKLKGLKPLKVYVNPHKKQLFIQYLDEESAIDRLMNKNN